MEHAHVINFSGGRTSAYMTYRLINERPENYLIIFENTGKEHPATLDFIHECSIRFTWNIVWLEYRYGNSFEVVNYESASRDGRPFSELIAWKGGFLPNTAMRYCTNQLKIETCRRYLQSIGYTQWTSYNGIRYDEPRRWSKMNNAPGYVDVEMPLVGWKVKKSDVLAFWEKQDFDLRVKEPYGNCDCCFLKGKGKLAIIAREQPHLLDWWIGHEKNNGGTFKKEISYRALRDAAHAQPQLFDNDPSFECFCNID